MSDLKKRSPQVILAELFETGKLADLSPEDKESLLAAMSSTPFVPTPAEAPAEEPEAEPVIEAEGMDEEKAEEPEPVQKPEHEDMEKSDAATKLAKRNVELEKRVAELEKAAQRASVEEMVKRDMAHFPGASVSELADVVQECRLNLGSDVAKRVETMLKAASEVCKGSDILKTAGIRKDAGTGDADSELLAIAKAARDADPKLSRHEALVLAGRQRPDLWAKRTGASHRA